MFFHKNGIPSVLAVKDRCFKRKISRMSIDSNKATKRAFESDSDSSQELNKRLKSSSQSFSLPQNYKNSIQYIHEIARIQPIKFELICQEGQAHKPKFKFCLTIRLLGNEVPFYSTGPSKKVSKMIASLKAISYLIKLPDFFIPEEIEYFKCLIGLDLQAHNLDPSLLDENEQSSFSIEDCESALVIDLPESQPEELSNQEFDLKTKEIIATKNPLIILNHLLPKKSFTDNLIEESGQSHSKIFKVEIRLNKNELNDCKLQFKFDFSSFVRNDEQNLSLFKDVGDDLIFYGIGSTKKIAKSRAAQCLLEILFNIKISTPGKYFFFN